jgi:phosphoribosylamine---glycine ligase
LVTIEALPENIVCFHAGTKIDDNQNTITSSGRVFGLTAWADTLEVAIEDVYANAEKVRFEGVQYRRDIGSKQGTDKVFNG